jgi:hypothetical protein
LNLPLLSAEALAGLKQFSISKAERMTAASGSVGDSILVCRDTRRLIAIFMLYLPYIGSSRAAMWGLIGSVIGTSAWFVLGKSTHALGPLFLA